MFSTAGDVQSIVRRSVHRRDTMSISGVFSTSWGYHNACGGYHKYIRGCSVHRGHTMSTSEGYHEYIGGCSGHRWDIMMDVGEQVGKNLSISIFKTPMY